MQQQLLMDTIKGLIKSEIQIPPPFIVVCPNGTNLKEQFFNGHDNGSSLEEEILKLPNVKGVEVGPMMGTHLKHYSG